MKISMNFEEPDIVKLEMKGAFCIDDVDPMYEEMRNYVAKVGKIKLLADINNLESIPPETREKVRKSGSEFTDWKMLAIYGASSAVKVLGGLILRLMPQTGPIKFFKTEEEARAWLAEEK